MIENVKDKDLNFECGFSKAFKLYKRLSRKVLKSQENSHASSKEEEDLLLSVSIVIFKPTIRWA